MPSVYHIQNVRRDENPPHTGVIAVVSYNGMQMKFDPNETKPVGEDWWNHIRVKHPDWFKEVRKDVDGIPDSPHDEIVRVKVTGVVIEEQKYHFRYGGNSRFIKSGDVITMPRHEYDFLQMKLDQANACIPAERRHLDAIKAELLRGDTAPADVEDDLDENGEETKTGGDQTKGMHRYRKLIDRAVTLMDLKDLQGKPMVVIQRMMMDENEALAMVIFKELELAVPPKTEEVVQTP